VECAIGGFKKAGSYTLLKDGVFTLDQLIKKAQSAKNAEVEGVYARIYMHGVGQRTSSLYAGSSSNIKSRMEGHNRSLRKQGTLHTLVYRRAARRRHRVLCNLDGNIYAQQNSGIRVVVEQLLVILLGTWDT
jgi:hypothetical protein